MKRIKSLLCLLIAVAMIFTLCACGSDKNASEDISEKMADNIDGSGAEEPSDSSDAEEPSDNANAEIDSKFDIGQVNGGKYENAFFGFGCELDSNWTYSSMTELLEISESELEQLSDEELRNELKNTDVYYDMMTETDDEVVFVAVGNLADDYGTNCSDYEEEITKEQQKELIAALEDEEMEIQSSEITTVQFAGAERNAAQVHAKFMGFDVYETAVIVTNGSYCAVVSISSYGNDTTADIIKLFYAV